MPSADRGKILRLLDANANRAREALRVWEDYARFVLDDQEISLAIKALRHDLSAALADLTAEAILHRDTPGDVGTTNKMPGELARESLSHVVVAAGKRLGEALRAMEEFAKIDGLELNSPSVAAAAEGRGEGLQLSTQRNAPHPSPLPEYRARGQESVAARIEGIRYRAYDIEARLARTLRVGERFGGVRLYAILSESVCKVPWLEAAEAAIAGGADCIQLREKTIESGEFLNRARQLVTLCRKRGVLCIINDRPDIAIMAEADGVHVGQTDLPAVEARRMVGERKIVGVSTHSLEQARQAVRDGADYVGIGPVYPSTTKRREFTVGLDGAQAVAAGIKIPAVAIAGITGQNVDDVLATGVSAVAVSAAIFAADDVKAAAESLRARIDAGVVVRDS